MKFSELATLKKTSTVLRHLICLWNETVCIFSAFRFEMFFKLLRLSAYEISASNVILQTQSYKNLSTCIKLSGYQCFFISADMKPQQYVWKLLSIHTNPTAYRIRKLH